MRQCVTPARGSGRMVIGTEGRAPQMPACPALLSVLGGRLEDSVMAGPRDLCLEAGGTRDRGQPATLMERTSF